VTRPASLTAKMKVADAELRNYIIELEKQNLKLNKQLAKLQVQIVDQENKILFKQNEIKKLKKAQPEVVFNLSSKEVKDILKET
jgi:hypothetical protein